MIHHNNKKFSHSKRIKKLDKYTDDRFLIDITFTFKSVKCTFIDVEHVIRHRNKIFQLSKSKSKHHDEA